MPKYTFKCSSCDLTKQQFVARTTKSIKCPDCDQGMSRLLPTLAGQSDVTETVDSYTGLKQREDHREVVEQRRDEYYWRVEVPRLVNSGTYSVETMLELGWIYLDEKDNIRINTKPKNKR